MVGEEKGGFIFQYSFHMAVYHTDNIGFATEIFSLLSFSTRGLSIDGTITAAAIDEYSHRRPYFESNNSSIIITF
jgi:hypothetical protein